MKKLTDFLEVHAPKSPAEKNFKKKHVTIKVDDANGNGDDVFQATNVKPVNRSSDRHGYNPGQDEKVYEETEQIDELKISTLMRYTNKGSRDAMGKSIAANRAAEAGDEGAAADLRNKRDRREANVKRAQGKLNMALWKKNADKMKNEEAEQIDELSKHTLNKRDSRDKNIRKAQGKLSTQLRKEEVEQIDELSKKTLGNYVKKAAFDLGLATHSAANFPGQGHMKKAAKREKGIGKAVDKLTREEVIMDESVDIKYRKNSDGTHSAVVTTGGKKVIHTKKSEDELKSFVGSKYNNKPADLGWKKVNEEHTHVFVRGEKNNKKYLVVSSKEAKSYDKEHRQIDGLRDSTHKAVVSAHSKGKYHILDTLHKETGDKTWRPIHAEEFDDATKLVIAEGVDVQDMLQKSHKFHTDQCADYTKAIGEHLSKHNLLNGSSDIHWGHVDQMEHIHRQLRDIHTSLKDYTPGSYDYGVRKESINESVEEEIDPELDAIEEQFLSMLSEEEITVVEQLLEQGDEEALAEFIASKLTQGDE